MEPLLLAAGLALGAALLLKDKGTGSGSGPGTVNTSKLPAGTKAALASGNTDPSYYYTSALIAYQSGDEESAKALLAACNHYRQKQGQASLPYPPTQQTAMTLVSTQPATHVGMVEIPASVLPSGSGPYTFNPNTVPESTKHILATVENPQALYQASWTSYQMGDKDSAALFLAKCNMLRMKSGKAPFVYPPTEAGLLNASNPNY